MLYFGLDELAMCQMLLQCYSGKGFAPSAPAATGAAGGTTTAAGRAAQQMLLGQPVTPPVTPQKAPQKFPVQLARPGQAAAGRSPLQALQPQPA